MCTLAIYWQTSQAYPVVVAANRDEFYERPATSPLRLLDDPWVVGGLDAVAGGTWLGVNAHHVVAGLLNRRTTAPLDPTRRSRGLCCLEALQHSSVGAAVGAVCAQPPTRYNPFNLLVASPERAQVVGNVSGAMRVTTLEPGVHLLTNLDLNDFECPRISKSYHLFEGAQPLLSSAQLEAFIPRVREILSDHSTPLDPRMGEIPNNLCMHSEQFGTRSSTLLVFDARAARFRLWHADGAPCSTPYEEVLLPEAVAGQSRAP